jgi:hypothetical protein
MFEEAGEGPLIDGWRLVEVERRNGFGYVGEVRSYFLSASYVASIM